MTTLAATRNALRRDGALAAGAVLLTVALWSSAFVGIRFADRQLSPGALALGRLLVGSLALGAMMVARRERLPPRPALAGVLVCGVLWFGAYNLALNAAERRIDAGTASMLVNIGPILIALLAGAVLREGFPRRLFTGCLVSFAGAALIGVATSRRGLDDAGGAVLCLLAALAYATGVVAQKPALRHASALSVTWAACVVGTASCLPYLPELIDQAGRARASTLVWTAYLGLAPTAVGFGLWAYVLARTTAGRLGSTTYLVPPLAILLGWAVLGEVPPALAIPGGLVCLVGVAVVRRDHLRWRRRAPSV